MPKIKLAESTVKIIKDVCARFNNSEGELINVLHTVQHKLGYLPAEVQEVIAKELNTSVAKVYGVVTFYSYFSMIPKGEFPISICMGTACYVRGAEQVLSEFKRQLKVEVGESTSDGKFSL
ncbi:MAG: NAD(P)H-dependent oxidoreductase subunit E, partial [Mariniphaga sp.]|nr:NAD(P)H-dependent oxidoreductase subunit E [Mariniphaga sp.]